jgi:hypothetical protein
MRMLSKMFFGIVARIRYGSCSGEDKAIRTCRHCLWLWIAETMYMCNSLMISNLKSTIDSVVLLSILEYHVTVRRFLPKSGLCGDKKPDIN